MRPSTPSPLAKDAAQQTSDYTHEEVKVTIYKEHDQKHPLILTLQLVLGDGENKIYATHPSSTVICHGKEEWYNAIEPTCVTLAKAIDNEAADDVREEPVSGSESAMELDLTLDFAKRITPNTKSTDEAEIWDPNAMLHLILNDIKAGECGVRRGFFKNADLREIDTCYRAVVARDTIVDNGPQVMKEAKDLLQLYIAYVAEQKDGAEMDASKYEKKVEKTTMEETGESSGALDSLKRISSRLSFLHSPSG